MNCIEWGKERLALYAGAILPRPDRALGGAAIWAEGRGLPGILDGLTEVSRLMREAHGERRRSNIAEVCARGCSRECGRERWKWAWKVGLAVVGRSAGERGWRPWPGYQAGAAPVVAGSKRRPSRFASGTATPNHS